MTEIEIKEQVDAFIALPRKERRAQYDLLPEEVQKAARSILEARRGIAKRVDGKIIHSKEMYIAHLLRLNAKGINLRKRLEKLPQKMNALKEGLSENYGEEALAEAEQAIAALGNE